MEMKTKTAAYQSPEVCLTDISTESIVCLSGGVTVADIWKDSTEDEW